MATAKKTAPKSAPKTKAEARVADSATKMIDEGMEQMTGFAGKFGDAFPPDEGADFLRTPLKAPLLLP